MFSSGLIVVAPIAILIERMDLRHGVKKRRARVLEQMPAIGDMDSMGQPLGPHHILRPGPARQSRSPDEPRAKPRWL